MILKINKMRGQSTVEYIFFLFILLGIFIYFQKFLVRGINGRMKSVGDSIAQGRLYDPNKTKKNCAYDFAYGTNQWYDADCFLKPGSGCVEECLGEQIRNTECKECPGLCQQCIDVCASSTGGQCDVPDTPSAPQTPRDVTPGCYFPQDCFTDYTNDPAGCWICIPWE